MTEDGRSRWGFLGSLGGAVLGGLTWVGVAGVTLHDGLVVSSAVLAAVGLWSVAAAAYARFPTRALGLLGAVILAVVLIRSEEHTSELQSRPHLVCRLLLEKKKKKN